MHIFRRPTTADDPRRTRSQALVEFALVLPVVATIFLFTLEIGWMLFNKASGLNAAREGSRTASLQPNPGDNTLVTRVAESNAWGLPIQQVIITVLDPTATTEVTPNTDRTHLNIVRVETVMQYHSLTTLFNFVPGATIQEFRNTVNTKIEGNG